MKAVSLSVLFFLLFALPSMCLGADEKKETIQLLQTPQKGENARTSSITDTQVMFQDIEDVADPVELSEFPTILIIAILTVVFFIVALVAFLYLRKKRMVLEIESPAEMALRELTEARTILESGDIEGYVRTISGILREFITIRFGIHAVTLTTSEFFHELQHSPEKDSLLHRSGNLLKDCLNQIDMIKFARHMVSRDTVIEIETAFRKFITASSRSVEEE